MVIELFITFNTKSDSFSVRLIFTMPDFLQSCIVEEKTKIYNTKNIYLFANKSNKFNE